MGLIDGMVSSVSISHENTGAIQKETLIQPPSRSRSLRSAPSRQRPLRLARDSWAVLSFVCCSAVMPGIK